MHMALDLKPEKLLRCDLGESVALEINGLSCTILSKAIWPL